MGSIEDEDAVGPVKFFLRLKEMSFNGLLLIERSESGGKEVWPAGSRCSILCVYGPTVLKLLRSGGGRFNP